jgi:hypothetical protein
MSNTVRISLITAITALAVALVAITLTPTFF